MRILSAVIFLQGLANTIQSTLDLINAKELRFGTYSISSNFNIGLIILGLCLMAIAIGIRYKKRFAYLSAIGIYSLLLVYGVFALCYFLFTPSVKLGLIFLIAIFIIYSLTIIFRTKAILFHN